MATDFSNTGAFNVNEQWATAVRYEAAVEQGAIKEVQLRFMNGRSELANIKVASEKARELLGDKNFAALVKAATDAQGPGHDSGSLRVKGELRGRSLEFRQVTLPGYSLSQDENAIVLDSRVPAGDSATAAAEKAVDGKVTDTKGERAPALQASDSEQQARLHRMRSSAVPDAVAERFLKVDDKYYFPDKKLAFSDRGTKLKAETNNLEVVRSIVAIAEARGWEALTVRGSKDFRKEVWREASLRGIDVRGHEPTVLERQELQRALEKRYGPNDIQRDASPTSDAGARPTPPAQSDAAHNRPASDGQQPSKQRPALLSGLLIDAGAAAYKFDPNENSSYYVKVHTERGERTLCGVDLERALAESKTGVKPGDSVTIENQGSKPVTVKTPLRDKEGNVLGEKEVKTHRNTWVVEKSSYFDERAEKAAAFRNGDRAKQELVALYPDLTNAIVTMRLGELFAEQLIDRPEDRKRLVDSLRETLADALERGETIQAPKIKEASVRKLDKIAGEVDEVAQRAAVEKAIKGAREVGARVKQEPQHVRL